MPNEKQVIIELKEEINQLKEKIEMLERKLKRHSLMQDDLKSLEERVGRLEDTMDKNYGSAVVI